MALKSNLGITPILRILGFLIILSILLPPVRLFFTFKPDLPLTLLAAILLINEKKVSNFSIITWYKILAATMFVWMFVSNNYGNLILGLVERVFIVPTEYMQILSRVMVFYVFLYLGYKQVITTQKFINFVSSVFILALTFAVLQVMKVPLVEQLSIRLYALTDTQKNVFESSNIRIFGTVGNAITWGGVAGFMFFFFYFLAPTKKSKVIGCLLSIISILFSSSRAALFAFIITVVFIILFSTFYQSRRHVWRKLWIRLILIVLSALALVLSAIAIIPNRVFTLMLRINNTESDLTERGRGAQLNNFWEFFSENNEYFIFGIGKSSLDKLGYMEIEMFFLLFAYGIIGFVLHYLLLWVLVKKTWALRMYGVNNYLFIIAATIFYLLFSIGFFFLREASSGLPFWWLCGYLLGSLFHNKYSNHWSNNHLRV